MIKLAARIMMFGWRNGWCLTVPWHRWRHVRRLSRIADKYRCTTCGLDWAHNTDVNVVLPWDLVRELYEARELKQYGRVVVD